MSNNRQNRKNISGVNGGFSFLPQITDRTSEQFLQDIIKIQENQYTPINHVPTLFGRRIDLLTMYNAVAQRGGLKKMITELSWEGVMKDLKIPLKCANACVALRSIYQRYLEQFERLQRNKATISDIEEELQIESENRYKNVTQKSTLTHFNINPNNMVYRSDMHQISSHKRQESGLSCELSEVFEYRNLEMSLKSGLVNEIEFSLNTCLLMSYQNEGVQLWRNPKILDLILASVSISDSDIYIDQTCSSSSYRRFLRFWNNTVIDNVGRKFLHPDVFIKDSTEISSLNTINQIFPINEELTIYDKEGQRIQLVGTIIRNLAFDNSNGRLLTQNLQCIRFIFLCTYASHFALRQLGLEILSTLKFPVCGILDNTLNHLLVDLIKSEDRVDRLRGLELISRLCDQTVCTENIDFFVSLPKTFFTSLISTLIVHDLHLLVLALEAVYGLSEIDPLLCCKLVDYSSETLITLYTLLSLEAQVMGTQSLIRIRVMQGPSVIAVTSNNSNINNRLISSVPHQNQKQLATSLMPPPPVPLHKVPISAMPVSHASSSKPQNYAITDLSNRSVPNQRIFPLITKNNTICSQSSILSSPSSNCVVTIAPTSRITSAICLQTSDTTMSLSTTKPFLSSQINVSLQYPILSQKVVSSCTPNFVPTTSLASVKSTIANISPVIKTTCISTPLPTLAVESTPNTDQNACVNATINTNTNNNHEILPSPVSVNQTHCRMSTAIVVANNNHPSANNMDMNLSNKDIEINTSFVNKQEFVKSWLLNNYIECSQCTVPLFLIYKQLQIAVQNHFRDSEMVSAEEFHKLVRLLFPQVQLVQLCTPGGSMEIHYYNLKSSPKMTALESLLEAPKLKPILSNSYEINNCNSRNNVPLINNAQSNCVSEPVNDMKLLKRHSYEAINGFSTELSETNHFPKKKPKLNDDSNVYNNPKLGVALGDLKENHLKNTTINGVLVQHSTENNFGNHNQKDPLHFEKNEILYNNINGSNLEDMKHSDSEMKAFSSSTVSPIHCESLANGTDGSSEGTMDSDLGKIAANITSSGTQIKSSQESTTPNSNNYHSDNVVTSASNDDVSSELSQQKRSYKRITSNQLGRTRSRFRNNGSGGKGKQRNYSNQRPHNLSYLYICEWDNCLQSFDKPQKVYGHVYTNHFMTLRTEVESICLWAGCEDKTQRTPLPLLNHVNEQHCNNVALESARQIRLASEKEKNSLSVSEATLTTTTESIPSPKFVNINSSNFQPKLSTTVSEIPAPSVAYQLVSQSSIPQLSAIPNSKISNTSILQPAAILNSSVKEPNVSVLESSIIQSQVITSIAAVIPASVISISLPSQKEVPITSSNHNKNTQFIDARPNSQILPKLRSPINPPPVSSSQSFVQSSLGDSVTSVESCQPIKQSIKEGPVTKHIRFLSALILRNLCQNSTVARRFVSARHQQIFEMSISGCESSMALSECLLFSSTDVPGNWENTKNSRLIGD